MPDFKKRRDQETEKIRKNNREEIFSKRRNILANEQRNPQASNLEMETPKKDKLLIVDERYRKDIEV